MFCFFWKHFCFCFLLIWRKTEWITSLLVMTSHFIFSNKGYRFMVFNNNTSQPPQTSFFESPLYERSYEGHNICVRFRYLIYGPGRHFLRIYQQLDLTDYPRRLMWAVNESNNTDVIWKYGRVTLTSVAKHSVMNTKSLCFIMAINSINFFAQESHQRFVSQHCCKKELKRVGFPLPPRHFNFFLWQKAITPPALVFSCAKMLIRSLLHYFCTPFFEN